MTTPESIRLMAWNVQRSSPARAAAQVAWLAQRSDADVLLLSEVHHSAGGKALMQALHECGYQLAVTSPAEGYFVLGATRVGKMEHLAIELEHLPQRFLAARLRIERHTLGIAGLYVPSRGPAARRNQDKRSFQAAVSTALPDLKSELRQLPLVVAGDLNVVEPGHVPHHAVFGEWEYRFYRTFAEHGLVDAFRALNPTELDHSWFGRSGNGYRFDHIFISEAHRGRLHTCRYIHEPRLLGLSDHSPIAVSLSLC